MGAVDLVIQIETPPSRSRAACSGSDAPSHQVGRSRAACIFPKFRGDLAGDAPPITHAMKHAAVEETRVPQNPLDVLAQQSWRRSAAGDVRRSTSSTRSCGGRRPSPSLAARAFEGVLDMLAGRYPSDEFAEPAAASLWDRLRGASARARARSSVVVANAGTIPDRGLYGVFLAARGREPGGAWASSTRRWCSRAARATSSCSAPRAGGSSRSRATACWSTRRPASRARCRSGRPTAEPRLGRARPRDRPADARARALPARHGARAAARGARRRRASRAQPRRTTSTTSSAATASLPDDQTIVLERTRDEMGTGGCACCRPGAAASTRRGRIALAAHLRIGGEPSVEIGAERRRHRAAAAGARAAARRGRRCCRRPDAIEDPVVRELPAIELVRRALPRGGGASAAAAAPAGPALAALDAAEARARPAAGRRRATGVVPDRAGGVPRVPERRVRRCRRFVELARAGRAPRGPAGDRRHAGALALRLVLLFGYVANYLYDGDAPLAERRAQALSVDQRAAPGAGRRRRAAGAGRPRGPRRSRARAAGARRGGAEPRARTPSTTCCGGSATSLAEIAARARPPAGQPPEGRPRRPGSTRWSPEARAIAVRDRRRVSATRPPRTRVACATRSARRSRGTSAGASRAAAARCSWTLVGATRAPMAHSTRARRRGDSESRKREVEGGARRTPARRARAFGRVPSRRPRPRVVRCGRAERRLRRRSLAALRKQVEPVAPEALARLMISGRASGSGRGPPRPDALLDVIGEQLQGAVLPASILERDSAPRPHSRLPPGGSRHAGGGRRARSSRQAPRRARRPDGLFLTDPLPRLLPARPAPPAGELHDRIREHLARRGASFFAEIHEAAGGGLAEPAVGGALGPGVGGRGHERYARAAARSASARAASGPAPAHVWASVRAGQVRRGRQAVGASST